MDTVRENVPDKRFLLSHPWHFISLGFGSGLSPVMPGTAGTLFAWISYDLLTWLAQFTGIALNSPDDGSMVWDEIIAFWLVLIFVTPGSFLTEFLAFIVFRFFDMLKPPPIRFFDQRIKGGFGVMLDDIIAAFFTLLVFALWKTCFMTT